MSQTDKSSMEDTGLFDTAKDRVQKNLSVASNTTTKEEVAKESEYEVIARDTATLLEQKLEQTRLWTKKLLRGITLYVKTLEEVEKEYTAVQGSEHQESDRLDQVEPDVQDATSQMLNRSLPGRMQTHLCMSFGNENSDIEKQGKRQRTHD